MPKIASFKLDELPDFNVIKNETPTTVSESLPILPGVESVGKEQDIDDGDPEKNEPFDEDLTKLRSHINQIEWGTKWFAVSKNKTVAQMAW